MLELESISEAVEALIASRLSSLRKSYTDFADKRAEVRETLALYATVQDMERRRAELESSGRAETAGAATSSDLPSTVVHAFAKTVESILMAWHFPDVKDVDFDSSQMSI